MKNEQRLKYVRRWAVLAIGALIIAMVATRPNAASERQEQYVFDTLQCLGWFISNHPQHEAECVGENDPGNASPGFQGVGTGTFTPPPTGGKGGKGGGGKDDGDDGGDGGDDECDEGDIDSSIPRFAAAGVEEPEDPCDPEPTGYIAPVFLGLFEAVTNI